MNLFAAAGLGVGITCALLSAVSFLFGRTRLHRRLLFFNIAVALWGFGCFLAGIARTGNTAILGWQCANLGGFFVGPSFYHLVGEFTGSKNRKLLSFGYVQATVSAFLGFGTNLIFNKTRYVFGLFYNEVTPAYTLAILLYLFFVLFSYHLLIQFYRKAKGYRRTQASYIMFGFLMGFVGATTTFLPMFRIDLLYPFGNFGIVVYAVILSYAILRHRIMEFNLVVRKSVVYSLSVSLLTGLFVVLVFILTTYLSQVTGITSFTITVISALIIALLFAPLKNRIQLLVDKVFHRTTYDHYATVKEISHKLTTTIELQRICRLIVDTIFDSLRLKSAYLLSAADGSFEITCSRIAQDKAPNVRAGAVPPGACTLSANYLKRKGIFIKEELSASEDQAHAIAEILQPFEGEALVPIFVEEKLAFLLIPGEKLSTDAFSGEDISLLITIADQASIALKNAMLYEELEKRVRERTTDLSRAIESLNDEIKERRLAEEELGKYRAHLEELVEQRTRELAVLNEQLQQSQKMEAVGLLAGGIAHEFNNILATIKGSIHLILKKLQADNPVIKYAEQISSSINKASSLCHDLLAFSRKQTITLRPVDFNGIIHMGTKLLSPIIGEDIEMIIVLTDKKPAVMADINQIEQVLLNLATNAQDAMPDGGRLTIRTEIIDMDEEFRKRHGYGVSGRYVLLSVSDTGVGMEEEIKEKIYEPFFTTKELGHGSGLGLAVTYGIVKQHNGFIDVETAPGKGTTFKLYLPAVEAKAVQQESRDVTSATEGKETILLAEDDHDARETMSEVLRLSGYTVLEAGDGESAVKVFMEKKDQIDLVFLDVRMPKKNGREVYEEIKKESRETAVLFMSGYTKDIIDNQGIIEEKLNFISKTATTEEILRKIREVLDK
ncbi:MAG: response regulator [Nitrospirota bacterium]|nr:response regulator [Nitrospirota bacterium]